MVSTTFLLNFSIIKVKTTIFCLLSQFTSNYSSASNPWVADDCSCVKMNYFCCDSIVV